jgi:ribulose-5-phosphate 4-epimerase/fuculose-1-phosphate aldolase
MRFLKIGYHEYQGVVLDKKEEASLLRDLGDGEALILRNHGLLTVGKTVGEAFNQIPPRSSQLGLSSRRWQRSQVALCA